MIYLFLAFSMLWADEDLPNLKCQTGQEVIQMKQAKGETYQALLPGQSKKVALKKPKMTHDFDKNKQLFDSYEFQVNGKTLLFKRPETEGPIKGIQAFWNKKTFDCQSL